MAHPTVGPRMLRGDEAQLYRDHGLPLRAAVRQFAHVTEALVDDACAHAWLQLCRTQPDRATVFTWLHTVAVREAWRLAERDRREPHVETLPVDRESRTDNLAMTLESRRALAALAALPDRQRRYLTLLVSGLSYHEICSHTGATHTTVSRHLYRARRHLRLIRDSH